jgi:heme iron utilization protein
MTFQRERDFVVLNRKAMLSSSSVSNPGYPFGSLVDYDITPQGSIRIFISHLAEHCKNLRQDSRSSLLVSDLFSLAEDTNVTRATLLMTWRELASESSEALQSYERRFPDGIHSDIASNFSFFVGTIERVRWIGGFGDIRWISGEEFARANHDMVAYEGRPFLELINRERADLLADLYLVKTGTKAEVNSLKMSAVNSIGFTIRCLQPGGQSEVALDFLKPLASASELIPAVEELARDTCKRP